jgi:hypothetical protein
MSRIAVVVEKRWAALLLRRMFRGKLDVAFQFFATGEETSLATVGRNILVHDGGPLLIVKDAETTDRRQAEVDTRYWKQVFKRFSHEDQFRVFSFVPELAVAFFEASTVLTRRFSDLVTGPMIEDGLLDPGATLESILSTVGLTEEGFVKELSAEDLEELRRGEQANHLLAAVEELAVAVGR